MILYHGSIKEIPNPLITIGRDKLDEASIQQNYLSKQKYGHVNELVS